MLTELSAYLRRYCLRGVLALLAGLLASIGVVLLVLGAFLHLSESMTFPAAAAVTGGGTLLAAGLVVLAVWRLGHKSSPSSGTESVAASVPKNGAAGIAELLITAEAAIRADARSDTPRFALLALVAGCALGASPRLRRALADLAR